MRISDWSSDVCSSDLGDDEERRADDGQAEAVEDRGNGHESLSGCGFEGDLNVNGKCGKGMRERPVRHRWDPSVRRYCPPDRGRSEEHTSELQSLMRISYAVFCLKKKKTIS